MGFNDSPKILGGEPKQLVNRVVVSTAADLAGPLSSTKEYFIDGVIDMGTQSIEVPANGLHLSGYNFDLSKLTSSEPNFTLFTSPVGGSGNLIGKDYAIEVTGANSKVYELEDATGFNAFEFARINYNDCTSLGSISGYRQGLETGTGRFGGTPSLTLAGTWLGGYLIDTSIIRNLDSGMTEAVFQAGTGLLMTSRFRSNQNVDLPANASYLDFSEANFPNPSTLQLSGCIFTREGSFNPLDTTILPNITASSLAAIFSDNNGIENTFVGGVLTLTSEIETVISAQNQWVDLAGTWAPSDLQHFDSPVNGHLRHLGFNPSSYIATLNLVIDGDPNEEIEVRVRRWRDSTSSFIDGVAYKRQINSLAGGRDVAFFSLVTTTGIEQNDYILLQVRNTTSTSNVTCEIGGTLTLASR